MAWALTAAETAFRDEVRDFLARELTPELRAAGRRCPGIFSDHEHGNRWHRILAARGWSVPQWPVEHGGTGWTPMQHYLFASELAAADAPPRAPMGPGMVAPVIIAFGTEAQKRAWLPGIRSGEDYWCQGYSEPQSGSDLASLQCKAVRDGEAYVLNGTKIWTTHAQYANKMFCLVRTTSGGKPQQGISFLCFDLPAPGVTIRPIISISGDHELNQVFFDDVRVPAEGLIGEENQGWTIAKYLLQHERGGAWAPMLRARLRRLQAAADAAFAAAARGVLDAPHPSDTHEADDMALRLADAECAIDAIEATELQSLRAQARGEPPGIRPSMGKVLGSELRQRLTELGVEIAAHYAAADLPLDDGLQGELAIPEEAVFSMSAYLNDRAASIYAGSNEVQRNIIAGSLLAN
jgi:alkylation response protein AidB-like acyl-CoA dehydrogenase